MIFYMANKIHKKKGDKNTLEAYLVIADFVLKEFY